MSAGLRLTRAQAAEMVAHCLDGRPNEACGVLAGGDGAVVKVYCLTNADASPVRYSLDPREQFEVYSDLDRNQWELAAIFHSHTRTEAYPSPTDVRLASEDVPYVIVSLAHNPPDIRAFRITKERWTDETGFIEEVPVLVLG